MGIQCWCLNTVAGAIRLNFSSLPPTTFYCSLDYYLAAVQRSSLSCSLCLSRRDCRNIRRLSLISYSAWIGRSGPS